MSIRTIIGDCRAILPTLPSDSVHCVVTSPPYWGLRDYGVDGQIGLEPTYQAFIAEMVAVFREVRRVLRPDGTLWLNLGDSYGAQSGQQNMATWQGTRGGGHKASSVAYDLKRNTGLKPKDLCGIPWRVAFALQEDGWWLRQDIIWSKPNPMPESVTDRCTKAHEYIFLLSKSERYYFDAAAIQEPFVYSGDVRVNSAYLQNTGKSTQSVYRKQLDQAGRNKRSVWEIATARFPAAHFATYPPALVEPCIKAGCPKGGTVLDPFGGAGTTGLVADRLQRNAILIELNSKYAEMAGRRIYDDAPLFAEAAE